MTPPNLVFIFTDEQRADTIHSPDVRMPHLNRLAEEGCHFTNALCTQPVCTPSRATIMTGLYPHATGAVSNNLALREDVPCLPELLPPALRDRYSTAYMGKWHLGDEIFAQHGFDHWLSIEDGYDAFYSPGRDREARSDYHHWLCGHGFLPQRGNRFIRDRAAVLPERYTKPRFLAEHAGRFIREHADRPFALYINFLEPHMPFFGPRSGEYDPDTLNMPANFGHFPGPSAPLKARLQAERFRRDGFEWYDLATEAGWRQMTAAYRGLCTLVDDQLGRILGAIEQAGIADNTIVVFTSDHGEMMGSHRLLGKGVMYQESVRVPCVLKLPGQQRGCRVDGPFGLVDLVPTLLELMGAPVPAGLHGRSLAGRLDGAQNLQLEEDVLVQWNGPPRRQRPGEAEAGADLPEWMLELAGSAQRVVDAREEPIRTLFTADNKRFSFSPILGEHELYDLDADPQERSNLLAEGEGRGEQVDDYLARIRAIQQRTDDPHLVAESLPTG